MASSRDEVRPRTFFLNESHELAPIDKVGGGRIPEYVDIPWAKKAERLSSSIDAALRHVQRSKDPLRDDRYFLVAKPVPELKKYSIDKKKAPTGTFSEPTDFGGAHGRVFDRLGLDLLQVTSKGDAIVHGTRDRVEQLLGRSKELESLGAREQVRWATLDAFETVPLGLRVDEQWLQSVKTTDQLDVIFELQPVLGRVDADRVLRTISEVLHRVGERLTGVGTDFSGRYWFRGRASKKSVRTVAHDFFSVQSIHSPLYSEAMASRRAASSRAAPINARPKRTVDPAALPCVAILDLGVPVDHISLAPYRRGQFIAQDAVAQIAVDHGSFVASRIVFGHCSSASELANTEPRCTFYDVVVGDAYIAHINDKIVMEAMRGVRGSAPDVRVFNLSFGDFRPLRAFSEIDQREKRLLLQDMDNFAFANDVLIVVAAGNSPKGLVPAPPYPNHADDPRWALGPWAAGYNTLVCGSYVGSLAPNGLAKNLGYPSPFTRVGPGLCEAPVPSFCAEGGNTDATFQAGPGFGVWGYSGQGLAEDRAGTSFAAPILAREAAFLLQELRQFCVSGTQPFGVTARAFLALTATPTTIEPAVAELARRTLGFGAASASHLGRPAKGSAVLLWQGIIESNKDVLRIQIPIPREWLGNAAEPVLRLMVAYDPPVNEAARELWACRRVNVTLHNSPEARAIRGPAKAHGTYPLLLREFKLSRFSGEGAAELDGDLWLLEINYDEIFDYPPGMEFDSRQRVAFAAELIDFGAEPMDPQPALQALPIAASMTRLSVQDVKVRNPLMVRVRS